MEIKNGKYFITGWRWQDLSGKIDRVADHVGMRISNGYTMYRWLKKTYYYTAQGNPVQTKAFNEKLGA
ncbi:MAG: hypothetical protein H8D23_11100 [Candidatus Brocadiales bacterium]|nr:hypothetical protein [Candidatus Brocadiales bacterium]